MISRYVAALSGITALVFAPNALAKPAEIITSTISCDIGSDTRIIIRDKSEPDAYVDGPAFSFRPFIATAEMYKRITSPDGQLRDVQVPLGVNIGNLNVKKTYIEDYALGFTTVVHAGLTPGVFWQSDPGRSEKRYLYTFVPAVAGTPIQIGPAIYSALGLRELSITKQEQIRVAAPFDVEYTNNPFRLETFVMAFRGSPAGASAKALIAHSYYDDDASNLIFNGHFDVHGKLPAA